MHSTFFFFPKRHEHFHAWWGCERKKGADCWGIGKEQPKAKHARSQAHIIVGNVFSENITISIIKQEERNNDNTLNTLKNDESSCSLNLKIIKKEIE